ncbi:unnamed protein product [Bathycoccus prasinos]
MSHKLVSGSEHNFMNYPGSEHGMKIWSISFFKYTRNTMYGNFLFPFWEDDKNKTTSPTPLSFAALD